MFYRTGKMRNVTMARAWSRWWVCIAEQHRRVSAVRRSLGNWRKGAVAKAWQAWEQRTRRRAQLAVVATKIIVRWQNAQVERAAMMGEGGKELREEPGRERAFVLEQLRACILISPYSLEHVQILTRAFAFAGVPVFGDLEADNIRSQSFA